MEWDNFSLMNSPINSNPSGGALPFRDHLRSVLRAVLRPLAKLAMSHGVKFQEFSDVLKLAYLDAGKKAMQDSGERINASTLSVFTGLHRKDLATFLTQDQPEIEAEPPIEARIFARWTTDPRFLNADGEPLALDKAAFEQLVRGITQDVRARAVLESMTRLDLVTVSEKDQIELVSHDLIPSRAVGKMLDLLRDNTRDHLAAAISNTMGNEPAFLEQSIYANGLSEASAAQIHKSIRKRWLGLTQAMVPGIQKAIDQDETVVTSPDQKSMRIRVGLYFYSEAEQKEIKP
jgi:hypothetical protein